MRHLTLAALLAGVLAHPALADETSGEILAYDRLANILVMRDRTVWNLGAELLVPADRKSGDRVRIEYAGGGESGIGKITSIERIEG